MAWLSAKSYSISLLPCKHTPMYRRTCEVAVVGAGFAGLVAARELRREGHRVAVFEKAGRIGGTWVYDPLSESDPAGRDPGRRVVHGSLYHSLRTNMPRHLMGFLDYPFARSYGDPRTFPAHREVLSFLEAFAHDFGVLDAVRLRTEVVRIAPAGGGGMGDGWVVESRRLEEEEGVVAEEFQAAVVCNGHHTHPRLAEIPGIDRWHGKEVHSHNYRTPEPFQDQTVVIIGKGSSAYDISREISKVASEVHLASRSSDVQVGKLDGCCNIWQHLMIKRVYEDGKVEFIDGSLVIADVIFHCTGYKYHFPFLETNDTVSIDENRVGPLYKHVFPPRLAPWLSFVGLPNKAMLSVMMELQSKWIAQILSGKLTLPTEKEMLASINQFYLQMEEIRRPKHHTHTLHPYEDEYLNWLKSELGLPLLEDWRFQMYRAAFKCLSSHHEFRDTWDADFLMSQLPT